MFRLHWQRAASPTSIDESGTDYLYRVGLRQSALQIHRRKDGHWNSASRKRPIASAYFRPRACENAGQVRHSRKATLQIEPYGSGSVLGSDTRKPSSFAFSHALDPKEPSGLSKSRPSTTRISDGAERRTLHAFVRHPYPLRLHAGGIQPSSGFPGRRLQAIENLSTIAGARSAW